MELPTAANMPHDDLMDSCECKSDESKCPMLEMRPGRTELRNVDCDWVEQGKVAACSFERRFIETADFDDEMIVDVSQWYKQELKATYMGAGEWCQMVNEAKED